MRTIIGLCLSFFYLQSRVHYLPFLGGGVKLGFSFYTPFTNYTEVFYGSVGFRNQKGAHWKGQRRSLKKARLHFVPAVHQACMTVLEAGIALPFYRWELGRF